MLPAYLVHSLVDVDWDYVAVSGPVFLVAGALAGGAPASGGLGVRVLAASGAALLAFGALLLPWLGHRWSGQAQAALAAGARDPARPPRAGGRSAARRPVLHAGVRGRAAQEPPRAPTRYYVEATHRQPANPETWQAAGLYAHGLGCPRLAYDNLVHFTELDPYAPGATAATSTHAR